MQFCALVLSVMFSMRRRSRGASTVSLLVYNFLTIDISLFDYQRTKLQILYIVILALQLVVVVLAALGRFSLWGAVLVDALTAIAVILNGMCVPSGESSTNKQARGGAGGGCCSTIHGSVTSSGCQDSACKSRSCGAAAASLTAVVPAKLSSKGDRKQCGSKSCTHSHGHAHPHFHTRAHSHVHDDAHTQAHTHAHGHSHDAPCCDGGVSSHTQADVHKAGCCGRGSDDANRIGDQNTSGQCLDSSTACVRSDGESTGCCGAGRNGDDFCNDGCCDESCCEAASSPDGSPFLAVPPEGLPPQGWMTRARQLATLPGPIWCAHSGRRGSSDSNCHGLPHSPSNPHSPLHSHSPLQHHSPLQPQSPSNSHHPRSGPGQTLAHIHHHDSEHTPQRHGETCAHSPHGDSERKHHHHGEACTHSHNRVCSSSAIDAAC